MEVVFEILVFLFELLFWLFLELILLIGTELLLAAGIGGARKQGRPKDEHSAFMDFAGWLTLGAILGGLSLLVLPNLLLRNNSLAVANLIVTPIIAGFVMWRVGKYFRKKQKPMVRLATFFYGYLFAFAFALVRYGMTWQARGL